MSNGAMITFPDRHIVLWLDSKLAFFDEFRCFLYYYYYYTVIFFKSANYCCLTHYYFFFLLPFAFFVFIFYTTSITILFPPLRWWYRMICALWTTYVSLYALIYTCQNLNWVKCLLSNKDINLLLYRHCFNSHSLHNWILGWMISINTK